MGTQFMRRIKGAKDLDPTGPTVIKVTSKDRSSMRGA